MYISMQEQLNSVYMKADFSPGGIISSQLCTTSKKLALHADRIAEQNNSFKSLCSLTNGETWHLCLKIFISL